MRSYYNIFEEGQVLLINKPYEWTSFDVVRRMRTLIDIKKIGHAGTLDPLATGLLIICTGRFTKKINEYMSQEKEYTGTIVLGARTPTYDLESEPFDFKGYDQLTPGQVEEAARSFTGEIMQVPPIYSAIKKDGRRAYEMARKGQHVELDARKVYIKEFSTQTRLPEVSFKIVCSTGTYIRSLANDLGERLECGGYLSSLCRTRIGDFELKDALTMEQLSEKVKTMLNQNG